VLFIFIWYKNKSSFVRISIIFFFKINRINYECLFIDENEKVEEEEEEEKKNKTQP